MSPLFVELSVTNLSFLDQDPIISCLCLKCPFTASYLYCVNPLENLLENFLQYIPLIKPLFCYELCMTVPWLTEKKKIQSPLTYIWNSSLSDTLGLQFQLLLFPNKILQLIMVYTHYILSIVENHLHSIYLKKQNFIWKFLVHKN